MEYQYAKEVAEKLKIDLENGTQILPGSSQSPEDLKAWDDFLTGDEKSIIELGTGDGVFSRLLAKKVDWFITVDIGPPREPYPEPDNFLQLDIFSKFGEEKIKKIISQAPRPLVLFCDNGDKPREVELFANCLTPLQDTLAVHDYQIEIHRKDIPEGFRMIFNYGLTAFFRRESPFE